MSDTRFDAHCHNQEIPEWWNELELEGDQLCHSYTDPNHRTAPPTRTCGFKRAACGEPLAVEKNKFPNTLVGAWHSKLGVNLYVWIDSFGRNIALFRNSHGRGIEHDLGEIIQYRSQS